ncbi:FadR/GntR family transcriptional regulator [Falsiroseomonas sp. HW251]|uniref:FadR/GntR family transcriptional regulator n=1 Tax=Falsiroseomonas sp. HW251 TaxID=3390998 RepID=UPI003D314B24
MVRSAAAPAARPASLADRVEEQIRRLIDRGEFPRDARLPSEFELCRRFSVSRPVLRAALATLKQAGYVSSLKGSGTVVLRGPDPGGLRFPLVQTIADAEQLYEFRATLEGEIARLAAQRRTPEALAEIEATLAEPGEVLAMGAPELARDANFRFHRAVARAAGNAFYVATIEQLPNLIGMGPVEVRNFGELDPAARIARLNAEHASILEAIRARDATRAQAEMVAHITAARQHFYQRHPARIVIDGEEA